MRYLRYFIVTFFLVGSFCVAQCPGNNPARFDRDIEQTHLRCDSSSDADAATIQWTITNPDTTKQLIEYRDITFIPGDQVLVSARGCVDVARNTDDHDWRRYVDPEGSGTDRHFHGLIWIPGASVRDNSQLLYTALGTGPVRISSVSGSKDDPSNVELLTIQPSPEGTLPTLRLGYEVDYDRASKSTPRPLAAHARANAVGVQRIIQAFPASESAEVTHSGQCKGQPIATVSVAIKRASQNASEGVQPAQSEARPTRSLLSFDPISLRIDHNGFMLSPLWYGNLEKHDTSGLEVVDDCKNFEYKHWFFVRYGVRSPCTQAASFDVPPGFITECTFAPGFGQLHGHVNWMPATFEGKLLWQERSADQDQDLQLKTLSDYERIQRFARNRDFGKVGGILTRDSQTISDYKDALWLEFASYETIDLSRDGDPYVLPPPDGYDSWENFLQKTKDNHKQLTAIVTGFLDLDCVHECHTELHPVLAMALRMKDEVCPNPMIKDESCAGAGSDVPDIRTDDQWVIFVRNSGNEGDCSADAHYLSRDSYTFFLPAPKGATRKIPQIKNRDTTFTASTRGITWSISPAPASDGLGALIRFSFAPEACGQIHPTADHVGAEPVRLGGTLTLNWGDRDVSSDTANSSNSGHGYPVVFKDAGQVLTCDTDSNNILSDDLTNSEKQSVKIHQLNPSCKSPSCLASALGGFIGREFGVFPEFLLYNKTSQVQINTGFRYSVVQTSLGSFEVEGAPGLSRSVRSNDGTNLSVRISDFLYGIKLRFPSALNIFGELKGGLLFRSASPGFSSTPDFFRFHGHDSLILAGGGIEPGKPTRTLGLDVSIRISADYMYLPGTSEHLVRITVGPQFQIPRHATR